MSLIPRKTKRKEGDEPKIEEVDEGKEKGEEEEENEEGEGGVPRVGATQQEQTSLERRVRMFPQIVV